jgi:hypothetical protein
MAIIRRDDVVSNTLGNAIAGAKVYYLAPQPANVAALTPLATVYSDTSGTVAANPQITDGFGHAVAYLGDGALYTVVYVYPNGTQIVYPDQFVGSSSGSPTPFSGIPSGTIDGVNRVFTIPRVLNSATVWLNFPLIPGLGYTIAAGGPGMIITYAQAPQPASGGVAADAPFVQGF